MKQLVKNEELVWQFVITLAITSTEEIGNLVSPPARRKLAKHGIGCEGKIARQMTRADYHHYDYIFAMNRDNLRNLKRMFRENTEHKICILMDYPCLPGDVANPWYTGILRPLGGMSRKDAEECWSFLFKKMEVNDGFMIDTLTNKKYRVSVFQSRDVGRYRLCILSHQPKCLI